MARELPDPELQARRARARRTVWGLVGLVVAIYAGVLLAWGLRA